MPGGKPKQWYWTVERLNLVLDILLELADKNQTGKRIRTITLHTSLAQAVRVHYRKYDSDIDAVQIAKALTILWRMEILDKGQPGSKKKGFKRHIDTGIRITSKLLEKARTKT